MTKAEFLEELEMILNEDANSLAPETVISQVQGWDSIGILGVIAFLDGELGVPVNVEAIRGCKTLCDIIALAGDKVTD